MKNLVKLTLIATGFAVALPFTHAATASDAAAAPATPAAAAPAAHAKHAKHARQHAMLRRRAKFQHRLAHKLGLNKDQLAQIKSIRANTRTSLKALRANTSLTPDQRKAQAHQLVASAHTQMQGVLTADQQAKLATLKAHVRGQFGGL